MELRNRFSVALAPVEGLIHGFKDGSLSDETGVFSQRGHFRAISHHLVQNGPAFEQPLDMMIDAPTGHVTVRYKNDKGDEKLEDEHMGLPPDLANGILITLMKNVRRDALPPSVSLVVATPKPRLVKLTMAAAPPDSHVWILEGEAPAFVRSQAPMFMGGPVWQTELVSAVWRRGR